MLPLKKPKNLVDLRMPAVFVRLSQVKGLPFHLIGHQVRRFINVINKAFEIGKTGTHGNARAAEKYNLTIIELIH